MAIPSKILNKLIPTTLYHLGVFDLEILSPPLRVGSACFPCRLTPTDKVGMMESKSRNRSEGSTKNNIRTPRVPTTSTRKGDCESTRVDHVM